MTHDDWRPRGATERASEFDGAPPPGTEFVVTCSQVGYSFGEGVWATFGRDDDLCAIPVWECLLGQELSRVAGVLWCVDTDLWVRNLSTSHELIVHAGAIPTHLPPRSRGRGAACSLGSGGLITAPSTGSWVIEANRVPEPDTDDGLRGQSLPASTLTLVRPPDALLLTAVAMCSPLLQRGSRPATYAEIAQLTGTKPRTARDRVDRLLSYYQGQGVARLWRACRATIRTTRHWPACSSTVRSCRRRTCSC